MRSRLAVLVVALLALACGGDDTGGAGDTGDTDQPSAAETLTPVPTEGPDGEPDEEADMPDADERLAFAIEDAAARAGVDPTEVTVLVDEDVTWPDGALGCPQPGQFYTQALVEGYRIVVEAGGQEYHYHGQTGQPPSHCANPSPPAQGGSGVVDR